MSKRVQDFKEYNSYKKLATSKTGVATKPDKKSELNKKTKKDDKKRRTKIIVFFVLLTITGVIIGCLFSPTFNLEGINVADGVNVTKNEILNTFNVEMNTNVFKINYGEIKSSVEKLPYIKSADVGIDFPNRLKIEYVEREPFALIKYLESFMVMDKYGYILEIVRENDFKELPIIYNIELKSYEIGKQLEDTTKMKFDNVIYLLENAKQNNFSYTISEVNYESVNNVKIWVKEEDIEIVYGAIDRNCISDKIGYIEEILNKTKGKKGKLDISGIDYSNGKIVFTERI